MGLRNFDTIGKVLPTTFLTVVVFPVFGQMFFSQDEDFKLVENKDAAYQELFEPSSKIESVTCDFIQHKELNLLAETVTSEGIFCLLGNDRLLWEYKTPYPIRL